MKLIYLLTFMLFASVCFAQLMPMSVCNRRIATGGSPAVISFDADSSNTNISTKTFPITVPSSCTKMIAHIITNNGGTDSLTFIDVSGSTRTNGTLLNSVSNTIRSHVYYWNSPAAGSDSMKIKFTTSRAYAVVVTYWRNATTILTGGTASGNSNAPTITVTTQVGDVVVDGLGFGSSSASFTSNNGQTLIRKNRSSDGEQAVDHSVTATSTSQVDGYSSTESNLWNINAIILR